MKNENKKLIKFLQENPNSLRPALGEVLEMKGLVLFNHLKKLQNEGLITSEGVGSEMTYTLVEQQTETPAEEKGDEKKDSAVVIEDQQTKEAPVVTKVVERNNDKFKFNNEEYGKGPLVRAVVTQYVVDNAGTTFKRLKEVFPDELLKRFGIFQDEQRARELSGKYDRYFFKQDHVIKLKDKKVVVCNQFTATNIQPFLKAAKALGYKIK